MFALTRNNMDMMFVALKNTNVAFIVGNICIFNIYF